MLVKFSVGMLLLYSRNKTLFSDLNAHLALDRDDHFTVPKLERTILSLRLFNTN